MTGPVVAAPPARLHFAPFDGDVGDGDGMIEMADAAIGQRDGDGVLDFCVHGSEHREMLLGLETKKAPEGACRPACDSDGIKCGRR